MPTPRSVESEQDFISRCVPMVMDDGTTDDNKQAVAICYSMWEDSEQQEADSMSFRDIAQRAIETARAVVNDSKMLGALAEAKGVSSLQMANKMLDELESELGEVTKTVAGKQRPADDFLVVEDPEKPSTWHLPVKVNGTPDHNLMGGAKAALTSPSGHRGNKYEGPMKSKAITKLKALYKSEDMKWTEAFEDITEYAEEARADLPEDYGPLTFEDLDAEEEARQAAAEASKRVYQYHRLIDAVMRSPGDKSKALVDLTNEFVDRIALDANQQECSPYNNTEWRPSEQLGDGLAVEVARDATDEDLSEVQAAIETGRRAPVVVDFQILHPGPGNKRDNRYYPDDVLERDIHVFKGADVFATDHVDSERSERTKVGKVLDCPVRFTETRAPVGRVLIYDPAMAEKTRNRADAEQLSTLECSIFGKGNAIEREIDGKKYKVVEAITQGKYLELVSKAGAGGKALNLAENYTGGVEMADDEKAKVAPVEEVEIEEAEADEQEPETQMLESDVVEKALEETNLPNFAKKGLRAAPYKDAEELEAAIKEAVAEVKKLTGSGRVTGLGESEPQREEELTVEEREKRDRDDFNEIMREVGLQEV